MKNENGITLIMLIITIIVMIILTMVVTGFAITNGGIFNRAEDARYAQITATGKEQAFVQIEYITSGANSGSINLTKTKENIQNLIESDSNCYIKSVSDINKEDSSITIEISNGEIFKIYGIEVTNIEQEEIIEDEGFFTFAIGGQSATITGLTEKGALEIADGPKEFQIPTYTSNGIRITKIGNNAFENQTNFAISTIPDNIESIGTGAFIGCTNIQSINTNRVTTIESGTFRNCSSLTSAIMPNVESIENMAFYYCSSLTTVEIPKVTSIGQLAFSFTMLESIDISNVTNLGGHAIGSYNNPTIIMSDKLETVASQAIVIGANVESKVLDLRNAKSIGSAAFYYIDCDEVILSKRCETLRKKCNKI